MANILKVVNNIKPLPKTEQTKTILEGGGRFREILLFIVISPCVYFDANFCSKPLYSHKTPMVIVIRWTIQKFQELCRPEGKNTRGAKSYGLFIGSKHQKTLCEQNQQYMEIIHRRNPANKLGKVEKKCQKIFGGY